MKHFNRFQAFLACIIGIMAPSFTAMMYADTGNGQPQRVADLVITAWYGNVLPFGALGNPVPDINILGNVTPSKSLISLTYTLNGGVQETLTVGPDSRRLEKAGDFNVDIPTKDLSTGTNQIIITATDAVGAVRETVAVNYTAGQTWPLPYNINWSSVGRIDDAAQVLDGLWSIQAGAVRPVELGYDRLIAIGDRQWSDYEITVPVTILGLDSSGFDPPSNGCSVGFLMRWPGHSDLPVSLAGRQPKTGYLPLGALAGNNWTAAGQRMNMLGNNLQLLDQDSTGRTLLFNTPYIFKMRVETTPGGGGLYKMKVWKVADSEPVEWDLVGQENVTDPQRGSVALLAHHVDALFGNVSVVPAKTTIPSSIVSDDFNTPAINTSLWTLVNPLGDASFSLSGTNTPNAWVNIGVPGGTGHDPWTSGNNAPRLIQPANNTDFEVEAKFESGISQRFQLQGIIAEESQNSFIRFEFHSDGTSTRMFVASLVNNVPTIRLNAVLGPNGTAPLYMRVKRVGSGWLMKYSLDGISWTTATSFNHPMNLTGIGPYGANSGTPPPAFTANIDYFFNTNSPIIPEDSAHLNAPAITQQPVNDTVNVGQTATFTVAASGSAPLSYQWRKNGVNIGGATSASYTTPAATSGDNGAAFRCMVSNPVGSATSAQAIMTVIIPPSITQQPVSDTVNVGQTATFSVVANGTVPLSYQWQKNGVNISGATSASYTTPAATSGDNGSTFRCVVSNTAGSVTSAQAILTVTVAIIPPAITQQPVSDTVNVGQTATFTVAASGSVPLSYQWQKNEVNIGGATSASYTTPLATSGDNGSAFRCVVSNAAGSVTSTQAILTVTTAIIPPAITQQPVSDTVNVGQTATFSVVASGTAPLSYRWQKNGSNISGATSASYTTPPAASGDNGKTFRCVVSNTAGSVTSGPAVLTVMALIPPTITQQPVNDTVIVGQTATFTVVANGSAPLSYQWKKNGSNISGATSASYTTPAATSGDNGAAFRCVVSNPAGSATSAQAILTVNAIISPPVITQHPVNVLVLVGQTATFTVGASGTAPLSYQWQKNGVNIGGATSASYTTSPTILGDNGAHFRCRVSNVVGSTVSNEATLHLIDADDRVIDGLLALYTFHEGTGSEVADVSGVLPPLDLEIANPSRVTWQPGYLSIDRKTVVRSEGPAIKIITAAMLTNELSIEAWIRPEVGDEEDEEDDSPRFGNKGLSNGDDDDDDDDDLARIVSNAEKQTMKRRNFSLESFGGNYIGRTRTTITDNQVRPNATSPDGVVDDELTHLLYTRSTEGVAKLYINGEVVTTASVGGNLGNWDLTYPLSIANEVSLNRPWYGDIHLVAMYGRALSPSEVQQNFIAGPDPELGGVAITASQGMPGNDQEMPDRYMLHQNYPNPFNPETHFDFSLPEGGDVSLVIYDVLGREVARLISGILGAGNHSVTWNGESSSSGVYIARFRVTGATGEQVYWRSNKLILMR